MVLSSLGHDLPNIVLVCVGNIFDISASHDEFTNYIHLGYGGNC